MERLPGCQPNKAICHGCRPNASHTLTHNLASEIVGLRPLRLLSLPPFPPGPSSPLLFSPFPCSRLSLSTSRFENSLRFCFIRPPHYSTIPKNALLTGFLRISRVTTTLFLIGERFRRTFPFNTRILYIYVYIQASRLNRRMNQIETFSFPPTFLIYIYIKIHTFGAFQRIYLIQLENNIILARS